MSENKLRQFIENHVPGFATIIWGFAIIEFAILIICVFFSSNEDVLRIYNQNNQIVYENNYNMSHITEFKTIYGIENFKDEGFRITRMEKENKFPTRAWIALSVSVPLALTLLVVFIVKVFEDVFHKEKNKKETGKGAEEHTEFEETRFEKMFSALGRLNIYALGCTAILIGVLFWMVPDLILFLGKISYQTLYELKWVLLGGVLLGGAYMILRTVLSYKTKTQLIKQQAEIQKNRDKLAIEAKLAKNMLIENKTGAPAPDK